MMINSHLGPKVIVVEEYTCLFCLVHLDVSARNFAKDVATASGVALPPAIGGTVGQPEAWRVFGVGDARQEGGYRDDTVGRTASENVRVNVRMWRNNSVESGSSCMA